MKVCKSTILNELAADIDGLRSSYAEPDGVVRDKDAKRMIRLHRAAFKIIARTPAKEIDGLLEYRPQKNPVRQPPELRGEEKGTNE